MADHTMPVLKNKEYCSSRGETDADGVQNLRKYKELSSSQSKTLNVEARAEHTLPYSVGDCYDALIRTEYLGFWLLDSTGADGFKELPRYFCKGTTIKTSGNYSNSNMTLVNFSTSPKKLGVFHQYSNENIYYDISLEPYGATNTTITISAYYYEEAGFLQRFVKSGSSQIRDSLNRDVQKAVKLFEHMVFDIKTFKQPRGWKSQSIEELWITVPMVGSHGGRLEYLPNSSGKPLHVGQQLRSMEILGYIHEDGSGGQKKPVQCFSGKVLYIHKKHGDHVSSTDRLFLYTNA